jgi:hypothetical protein
MSLPYATATAGDRALMEMQKTLKAFGCQSFGTMTDEERGCMIVAFKWRDRQVHLEANWKGYAVAWQKEHPYTYRTKGSRAEYDRKALAQARTSICSVLRDWVKGQTTAIECGVLSFEAAFMPHMLLKDGRRVIDAAQAANLLPPPEESNVVPMIATRS